MLNPNRRGLYMVLASLCHCDMALPEFSDRNHNVVPSEALITSLVAARFDDCRSAVAREPCEGDAVEARAESSASFLWLFRSTPRPVSCGLVIDRGGPSVSAKTA